jgi:DNA-binding response OmpR family regulator
MVVEDDAVSRHLLSKALTQNGYEPLEFADGQQAYDWLLQNPHRAEAMVLDRSMPRLDGLSVVRLLRQKPALANLPVVMVTAATEPEDMREGIGAGVFYYLTKPVEFDVFATIIAAAVKESRHRRELTRQLARRNDDMAMLKKASFTLQTVAQAERLSLILAPLFPQPELALKGVAALLLNAVEHGRLRIGFEKKTALLRENRWAEEIRKLEHSAPFANQHVQVDIERLGNRCRMSIRDPGEGFDWRRFIDLSPDRATAKNGRGIAQARVSSFDKLMYSEAGNIVVAEAGVARELEW